MLVRPTGMNHVAISVPSIKKTVEWYQNVFGFEVIKYSEIPDTGIKSCHMQGPGFQLEIFQPTNGTDLPEYCAFPHTDFQVHGHKHFCMSVADGKLAKKQLEDAGIEIVLVGTVDNTYSIFFHDNSGILIELFEDAG